MSRILVTGAAGFIGSNLANYLHKQGHDLILVDSLEYGGVVERLNGHLRSQLIVDNLKHYSKLDYVEKVDIVVHLGGISSLPENEINPRLSVNNNFLSTVNLYEKSVEIGVKQFYFASTSAVYENNIEKPFEESLELSPDLLYSYSKKASEDYLRVRSSKIDATRTTVLRFFNVFGFGQNTMRLNPPLTGYLVERIITGRVAVLYNKSHVLRDYIYVKDVVNILGLLFKLRTERGGMFEIFNLCSGNLYSVAQIIGCLEEVTKSKLRVDYTAPSKIWNKYKSIASKVSDERIVQEVFKASVGSNRKLREFIDEDYDFTTMEEGIVEMYNYGLLELGLSNPHN